MSESGVEQEELNFFRLFKLTMFLGSEVLAKHIEKYCEHKGCSFGGLLNNEKHTLWHLKKSSSGQCCCGKYRKDSTISMNQWKQLFDESGIRHPLDTSYVDCYESSVANSTVQASDLDISLLSCIILGVYDILKWMIEKCYPSFEDFLNCNFHSLYHHRTRYGRLKCCKCSTEGPKSIIFNKSEWDEIFQRNRSSTCHKYRRNRVDCSCQYSIKRNLLIEDIPRELLLKIGHHIGYIVELRNIRNGFCHVGNKNIRLAHATFVEHRDRIRSTLLHLAEGVSPSTYRTEVNESIDSILNGPIDDVERRELLDTLNTLRQEQQEIVEIQKRIEENQEKDKIQKGKDEKRCSMAATKLEVELHNRVRGVRTESFQNGQSIFNNLGVVIFIGNIGQGKTWNALELLSECLDNDVKTIVKMDACLTLSNWSSLVFESSESDPSIVFIDNIRYENLENNKAVLETMMAAVNHRCVRIIATMTVNEHAILEKRGYLPPLFKEEHMVFLSETENEKKELLSLKIDQTDPHNLSIVDKKAKESFENDFDMRISEETISEIADILYTDLGFPQCCAMFLSDHANIKMGSSFFKQPFRVTIEKMKDLGRSADITKKLSFFILSNTLICKTFVMSRQFQNELQRKIFDALTGADYFGVKNPVPSLDLQSALEHLPDAYITEDTTRDGNVCYKLKHDSIKRSVFIAFSELGEKFEEFMILHCPIEMLENISHEENTKGKHQLRNRNHFLERILCTLCREYPDQHAVYQIIKHPIMSSNDFVQKLQEKLKFSPLLRRKMKTYGVKYDNKVVLDAFGKSKNEPGEGSRNTPSVSDDGNEYRILERCCTYHSSNPNKDLIRQVETLFENLAPRLPTYYLQQLLQISVRYFNKVTVKALLNLDIIRKNEIGPEWFTDVNPLPYNVCLLEESISNNVCISKVHALMDTFYSIEDTIDLIKCAKGVPYIFAFLYEHQSILLHYLRERIGDHPVVLISEDSKSCAFTLQESDINKRTYRPDIEEYVNSNPRRITLCILNRSSEFQNQVLKDYGCCTECTFKHEALNTNNDIAVKILGNVEIESTIFYEEHSKDDRPISSYTALTFCEYHYAEFDFEIYSTEIGCVAEQVFKRRRQFLPHLPKGREMRNAFCKACEKGHFELASFVLRAFDSLGTEKEQRVRFEEGLRCAVDKGHARIVDAVMSWKSEFLDSSLLHTVFDRACELRHHQIVRYLMTRYFANAANRTQSHSDDITLDLGSITKQFCMACEKCDLKTAEVLLVHSVQEDLTKKMNDKDIKEVYDKAIKSENIDVVNMIERVAPLACPQKQPPAAPNSCSIF